MNSYSTAYQPNAAQSDANTIQNLIDNNFIGLNTLLPCSIQTVNDDGSFDVQSLVNNTDIGNVPITPPIIPSLPLCDIVANSTGIVLPPYAIGDIVLVAFFQRDCSSVIQTGWTQQNPGSSRKFNLSDGIIIARISTNTPTYSIKFETDGTITVTGTTVNVNATNVNLGNGTLNGVLTATTQFEITGIQAGTDTVTNTITVYNDTESQTVKASS